MKDKLNNKREKTRQDIFLNAYHYHHCRHHYYHYQQQYHLGLHSSSIGWNRCMINLVHFQNFKNLNPANGRIGVL